MEIEEKFAFGKYKGLSLIDVYKGTLNIDRQLLRDYLNFLLNTDDVRFRFENNFDSQCFQLADKFEVNDYEIQALTFYETRTNDEGVPYGEFGELGNNIKPPLEQYISICNSRIGYEIGGFVSLAEFSKSYHTRYLVGADPGYLFWCIKNIDNFFLSANNIDLLEKLEISIFKGIRVFRKNMVLSGGIYEYCPDMEIKYFSFPEKIKELNQAKIEASEFQGYDGDDDRYDNGPSLYGYESWDEMAFYEAFEGDSDAWEHYNQ
ncbi:hypothetical protein [Botryobacter ruber]|uniref:hypothetical protein n=1 Tax=Botryobacter ruber TaxID=2171629 RepID=UPI000E0A2EF3|nr:hypothetical protein [Botryobacter ruber]